MAFRDAVPRRGTAREPAPRPRRSGARRNASRIAAVLMTLLTLSPVRAATAVTPVCALLAFSAEFARDRTGFCLRVVTGDQALFRTHDAGRTWERFGAPGVAAVGTAWQLMVSPRYSADRTVYLHSSKGLFAWSDPSTGFLLADPLANAPTSHQVMAPFVEAVVPGAVPQVGGTGVGFALADQTSPAWLSPPARRPVSGAAPSLTDRFLVPPAGRAAAPLAIARVRDGAGVGRAEVRQCDWDFACPTVLATLPAGTVHGAWLSPRYAQDHTVYVVLATKAGVEVLRSTASGRRFAALRGAARALAATNKALRARHVEPGQPTGLAMDTADPRRLALRVPIGPSLPGVPAEQVFTSADGGATWRRAGYAWGDPRGGTLPWYGPAQTQMWSEGSAVWYVAGRLFALATDGRDRGGGAVYCSVDHARSWRRGRCA